MRKRDGPSFTLRKRKTWISPMMPLKARQHQGPVQMSGCWEMSQKEAVSQWKPAETEDTDAATLEALQASQACHRDDSRSPATPQTHQLKTLAKNMRQATLAPSMPALQTSWHSMAAGGMAKWPGRIRQQARLYSTRAQEMDSTQRPQEQPTRTKSLTQKSSISIRRNTRKDWGSDGTW